MWEQLRDVLSWLSEPVNHFLAAWLLAWLVLWSMWTIYYAATLKAYRSGRSKTSMAAKYGMAICCLLVALSVGLLSHYMLDSFSAWYSAPINPHLVIIP